VSQKEEERSSIFDQINWIKKWCKANDRSEFCMSKL